MTRFIAVKRVSARFTLGWGKKSDCSEKKRSLKKTRKKKKKRNIKRERKCRKREGREQRERERGAVEREVKTRDLKRQTDVIWQKRERE